MSRGIMWGGAGMRNMPGRQGSLLQIRVAGLSWRSSLTVTCMVRRISSRVSAQFVGCGCARTADLSCLCAVGLRVVGSGATVGGVKVFHECFASGQSKLCSMVSDYDEGGVIVCNPA